MYIYILFCLWLGKQSCFGCSLWIFKVWVLLIFALKKIISTIIEIFRDNGEKQNSVAFLLSLGPWWVPQPCSSFPLTYYYVHRISVLRESHKSLSLTLSQILALTLAGLQCCFWHSFIPIRLIPCCNPYTFSVSFTLFSSSLLYPHLPSFPSSSSPTLWIDL